MKKENLLQIRIEDELLDDLKNLAESNSISVSAQVRLLIKMYLRNLKKANNG